jgi:hypothetical protein
MKTLILISLLSIAAISNNCAPNYQDPENEFSQAAKDMKAQHEQSRKTITLEGCEYWESFSGKFQTRTYSLTHKGNCSNKIHKCG